MHQVSTLGYVYCSQNPTFFNFRNHAVRARVAWFTEFRICRTCTDKKASQCVYGPGSGTKLLEGTSVVSPQVAAVAAILIVHYNLQTAAQVKKKIVGLAHSRNGGPNAIYIGNSGDLLVQSSSSVVVSTVRSMTPHPSVHSSPVAQLSSSTTPSNTPSAKTSSTVAAVQTTIKSHCDDRAWYGSAEECEFQCNPQACTEVTDDFSNEFPSWVCEC